MSSHYTARSVRKGPHRTSLILNFFIPLIYLVVVANIQSYSGRVPLWLMFFGALYAIYRIGRRLVPGIDPARLYLTSCSIPFAGMYTWNTLVGGQADVSALLLTMALLFGGAASIRAHSIRLSRLEAPVGKGRLLDFPGIYCITCHANGKQYIGQTSRPIHERWQQHRQDLHIGRHHNRWLQGDWNLYRPEQFSISVLEVVTDPVWLFERERYWQDKDYDASRRYNPPNAPARPALVKAKSPVRRRVKKTIWVPPA